MIDEGKLAQWLKHAENLEKSKETNEEATKMSLVMPFFAELGYNVFNPNEFAPEVSGYKSEKLDYAIYRGDDVPSIIIEVKAVGVKFNNKHLEQVERYFAKLKPEIAILTDGLIYKIFGRDDKSNLIEKYRLNLTHLRKEDEVVINLLKKDNFDADKLLNTMAYASEVQLIVEKLKRELQNPSDWFVTNLMEGIWDVQRSTKRAKDEARPKIKEAWEILQNDIRIKLKTQLFKNLDKMDESDEEMEVPIEVDPDDALVGEQENGAYTTRAEIKSWRIVQDIIRGEFGEEAALEVLYQDYKGHFVIYTGGQVRAKRICEIKDYDTSIQLDLTIKNAQDEDEIFELHHGPTDLLQYTDKIRERYRCVMA